MVKCRSRAGRRGASAGFSRRAPVDAAASARHGPSPTACQRRWPTEGPPVGLGYPASAPRSPHKGATRAEAHRGQDGVARVVGGEASGDVAAAAAAKLQQLQTHQAAAAGRRLGGQDLRARVGERSHWWPSGPANRYRSAMHAFRRAARCSPPLLSWCCAALARCSPPLVSWGCAALARCSPPLLLWGCAALAKALPKCFLRAAAR